MRSFSEPGLQNLQCDQSPAEKCVETRRIVCWISSACSWRPSAVVSALDR